MSDGMRELRGNVCKPPLGVPPAHIVIDRRIAELAEVIGRYATGHAPDRYRMIAEWAAEIAGHCETMREIEERVQGWET